MRAGDPHRLRASPSPGDARDSPHPTHESSRASLKLSMLFLNPALGAMERCFHARFCTQLCFCCLGTGRSCRRSSEQRCQTGSTEPGPAGRAVFPARTHAGLLWDPAETFPSESTQVAAWLLSETFVLISDYANKQLCHAPGSRRDAEHLFLWQASVPCRSSQLLVPSVGPVVKSRLKAA